MVSENTILTEKWLKDIEDIIIASGRIVTTDDVITLGETLLKSAGLRMNR